VELDAIREQAEAVTLLRRAISMERVAHAYAFVGPEASGRKATALAFASALVAPQGGPAAARVERGRHPDVYLLGPTPPPSNPKGTPALRIEAIRELERRAALKPAEAAWKVFIVDEAEKMTAATPQALLKTLEEPPARTVIILILSQIRALPATVLSRCQRFDFRPISPEQLTATLTEILTKEGVRFEPGALLAHAPAGAHVSLVPTMLERLVRGGPDLSVLGAIVVGGGALDPAMNDTTGLVTCSAMNSAARSSSLPPISPIMTMYSVASSAWNISSTSTNFVPMIGSPPMPTQLDWPSPARVSWSTTS